MAGTQTLDATHVNTIPEGLYLAEVVHVTFEPVGYDGRPYLELTFRIVEGPHAGRQLTRMLDPVSPNSLARTVYRLEITKLCRAANVAPPRNWTDPNSYGALYGAPLFISVRRVTYTDTTGAYVTINQVVDYTRKK